jgi:hypothetical protein
MSIKLTNFPIKVEGFSTNKDSGRFFVLPFKL